MSHKQSVLALVRGCTAEWLGGSTYVIIGPDGKEIASGDSFPQAWFHAHIKVTRSPELKGVAK